jgi:hypothetical protein
MLGFLKRRRHPIGEVDLSAYVDGRVSPDERHRLEEHLRSCPACVRKLEGLRTVVAELRNLPRLPAPRSFALTAAQAAVKRDERPAAGMMPSPAAGRLYLAFRGGAIAAALFLFATVGADLFLHSPGATGEPTGSAVTGQGVAQPSSAFGEESGATGGTAEGQMRALPKNDSNLSPSPTVVPGAMLPPVPALPPTVPAFEKTAATPAPTGEDRDGRRWLWTLEGAAGGLALGLGVSAFWLRRLARRG